MDSSIWPVPPQPVSGTKPARPVRRHGSDGGERPFEEQLERKKGKQDSPPRKSPEPAGATKPKAPDEGEDAGGIDVVA